MITTRLFLALIVLLLLSQLLSCTDHRIPAVTPGTNRYRINRLTQQPVLGSTLSKVSTFSYDSQNRLSSILTFQLPDSTIAPVESTFYQYDGQNRLTQVQHLEVRRPVTPGFPRSETYTLTYNALGQLSNLVNSPSTFFISPQYDAANRVISYSKGINVGGLQSSGGGSFTFTGNNLTSSSETFSITSSGGPNVPFYSQSINTDYTYDTFTNPFYGIYIIPAPGVFLPPAGSTASFGPFYTLYGGIDNLFNLSQNNVLSAKTRGTLTSTTTYAYVNAANLPATRITTTGNNVTEVLFYEYEAY